MTGWESVVDQDRDEWRSAATDDAIATRRIGGQVYDADDVPDREDA